MSHPSRPPHELLVRQAEWLRPARARLLRRVHVARRRRVLELACASGAVTGELVRRAGGPVVALDRDLTALADDAALFAGALRVCGDAARLPFAEGVFDLVFSQFSLLWLDAAAVLAEVRRVLLPGGVLVALEPDFGGMIEHPPELATGDLWTGALRRAGADPQIGRKLPGLLCGLGFDCRVDLLERLVPPDAARYELLGGLALTEAQRRQLARIRQAETSLDPRGVVAHLPMLLVTATRRD